MDGNFLLPFDLETVEGQNFRDELLMPPGHIEEDGGSEPGTALTGHVTFLGAKMAILEFGYVDQDYRDEFAAFYAGCFPDISSLCDRLLFFSDPFRDAVTPESVNDLAGFLGYVVLRPLVHARIGRTVLQAQPTKHQSITCIGPSHVHLLGRTFEVIGTPFMQQTTEVTSCAQIAIWSAARFMGLRHGLERYTPAEVNDLATREYRLKRTMPTDGLEPEAMAEALSAMGLGPLVYSPRLPQSAGDDEAVVLAAHRDVVVRALASALPPIIVIEDDERQPYHAVTAIGINWVPQATVPVPLGNVGHMAESFVVNDDLKGPYGSIEFGPDAIDKGRLERVILPLPKKIYLKLEDAEEQVLTLLQDREAKDHAALYPGKTGKDFKALLDEKRVLLNTYAIGSVEYKKRAAERIGPQKDFVDHYLSMRMPKWLVITEFVVLSTDGRPLGICGEVVMDSTAHVHAPPFLAVHLPGIMIIHESEPTDSSLTAEGKYEAAINRRWRVVDDKPVVLADADYYPSCSAFRFPDV